MLTVYCNQKALVIAKRITSSVGPMNAIIVLHISVASKSTQTCVGGYRTN